MQRRRKKKEEEEEEEEEEKKKKKKKKERAHCYPHSSITSSSPQVYQLNLEHTQSQTLPCVFTPIS